MGLWKEDEERVGMSKICDVVGLDECPMIELGNVELWSSEGQLPPVTRQLQSET